MGPSRFMCVCVLFPTEVPTNWTLVGRPALSLSERPTRCGGQALHQSSPEAVVMCSCPLYSPLVCPGGLIIQCMSTGDMAPCHTYPKVVETTWLVSNALYPVCLGRCPIGGPQGILPGVGFWRQEAALTVIFVTIPGHGSHQFADQPASSTGS